MAKRKPKRKGNPKLLLHPQIPRPLHGVNPRNILGPELWQQMRTEALWKTEYHCAACGIAENDSGKPLEVHEMYDFDYKKGIAKFTEAVALCNLCHAYIHMGCTELRYENGDISYHMLNKISEHGRRILEKAKLLGTNEVYVGKIASSWKLIFNGQEYNPDDVNIEE